MFVSSALVNIRLLLIRLGPRFFFHLSLRSVRRPRRRKRSRSPLTRARRRPPLPRARARARPPPRKKPRPLTVLTVLRPLLRPPRWTWWPRRTTLRSGMGSWRSGTYNPHWVFVGHDIRKGSVLVLCGGKRRGI